MDKSKKKKLYSDSFRHKFQAVWGVVTNSFITGFLKGKIYTGKLKYFCVPGLNCYSCPGALGSCPIGALQAVFGSGSHKFAFYVIGFLMFVGAVCGRFVCGWLCPFGLIQDLIHKIPFFKKIKTFKGDKILRYLKYVILALFVIILPMFALDEYKMSDPWFCKYICPAGTLEGGLPLAVLNEGIRASIGWLYAYKVVILVVLVIVSLIIYRPFCKYICPLGAIYSAFNKISVFKLRCDESKCVSCGKCARVCKMNVDPTKIPDSTECIRCGKCVSECPVDALQIAVKNKCE
ncbi:MAG: 4Fe-4S binding protein [Clostridia bacterium]|nr:4Fe-4S binding protein [Clostridia bacterium]